VKTTKELTNMTHKVSSRLTPVEAEVIHFFVEISHALGQRPSYAEIYGLLFISPKPLTMQEIYERLEISKGSASMGLKFLREVGAVRELENPDSRSTQYEAVAELRRLAGRFLRDRIAPPLAGSETRLTRLEQQMGELPPSLRAHAKSRVKMLQSWNLNSRRVLPLIVKLLGS